MPKLSSKLWDGHRSPLLFSVMQHASTCLGPCYLAAGRQLSRGWYDLCQACAGSGQRQERLYLDCSQPSRSGMLRSLLLAGATCLCEHPRWPCCVSCISSTTSAGPCETQLDYPHRAIWSNTWSTFCILGTAADLCLTLQRGWPVDAEAAQQALRDGSGCSDGSCSCQVVPVLQLCGGHPCEGTLQQAACF